MKHIIACGALLLGTALAATAQVADPVLMQINHKPVTRSEFEYFYNKNNTPGDTAGQVSLDDYVRMFVNYKLKVEAAEAMRLDTLSSFRKEFQTYRDMQLTPYFVDTVYIDSVARAQYQRTVDFLAGADLLHPAHIFLRLSASAGEAEKAATKQRADSIYNALRGGADFAELAARLSEDPGSARNGGQLPWIGPKSTIKEFEDVVYAMQPGELSQPFLTPVGYHIVLLKERKALEPYAELRPQIISRLKQQGIEEQASEHLLGRLVAASGGRLTREQLLTRKMEELVQHDTALRYLIMEYHDGLLMYEAGKREVWDKAKTDSIGLAAYYKKHKRNYRWTEPRFDGFVVHAKSAEALAQAKTILKKYGKKDWARRIKAEVNRDSLTNVLVEPAALYERGRSAVVDSLFYGSGRVRTRRQFPFFGIEGKKVKQPRNYKDVIDPLVGDYQAQLEEAWVEALRRRYTFSVDNDVLRTVNNH